jgi:hypothetical protein
VDYFVEDYPIAELLLQPIDNSPTHEYEEMLDSEDIELEFQITNVEYIDYNIILST